MRISTIIIAKNEAENLKKSLPKLHWCDDIVVVDDFSTDDTVAIAKSFGAKVFSRNLDGFGTQKQFATAQTSNNWVLNIDADEVISDALIDEIKSIDLENTIYDGFEIPIRHVFLGKPFKYGKESKFMHLRFFNKQKGGFDDAKVHEKVTLRGKVSNFQQVILHYSYANLEQYFTKLNKYTSIGAEKLFEKGKKRKVVFTICSFPFYFIKHFLFYGNILNGKEGFIWS